MLFDILLKEYYKLFCFSQLHWPKQPAVQMCSYIIQIGHEKVVTMHWKVETQMFHPIIGQFNLEGLQCRVSIDIFRMFMGVI